MAVPAGMLVDESIDQCAEQLDALLPAVVKPAFEGSSKGISRSSLVGDREELRDAVGAVGKFIGSRRWWRILSTVTN